MLRRCEIDKNVIQACLSHALSTEREEVMGLLLGEINRDTNIVQIKRSLILTRRDKQADRVEIAFEDLSNASTIAEQISNILQEECKIVGWYHSHPHITVLPSAVDVKTQGEYQALDKGFIGLIFSVFDKGKMDVCAFQSFQADTWERVEIPIVVTTNSHRVYDSLLSLQVSLLTEERLMMEDALYKDRIGLDAAAEVYSSSSRLIADSQLTPLYLAMLSRNASLTLKKQTLLRDVAQLKSSNVKQSSSLSLSSSSVNGSFPPRQVQSESVFSHMMRAFPSFVSLSESLHILLGGFEVSSIHIQTNERGERGPSIMHGRLIKVRPTSIDSQRRLISPWYTDIDGSKYYIIGTQESTETANSISLRTISEHDVTRASFVVMIFSGADDAARRAIETSLSSLLLREWI